MKLVICLFAILSGWNALAKVSTGRQAAAKYFIHDRQKFDSTSYISFFVGQNWFGKSNIKDSNIADIKSTEFGGSFSIGKWSFFDVPLRIQSERLSYQEANKISMTAGLIYPRAKFDFPIYLGATAGLAHVHQSRESIAATGLENIWFVGARFFNAIPPAGVFIEFGSKSFSSLLDQFKTDSKYLALGLVFRI